MPLIKLRLLHCSVAGAIIAGVVTGAPGMARAWTYHDIYRFKGPPSDGATPFGGLVADAQGRLYGTATGGGVGSGGIVFRLDPPPAGQVMWTEEILHSFSGPDGAFPTGNLVLGSDGSVYGTTLYGGSLKNDSDGTVFKLTNAPGWPISILHNFYESGTAGNGMPNSLTFGPNGLLYGTTELASDAANQSGSVFSVSPEGDSVEFAVIHKFGKGADGRFPAGIMQVPASYFVGFVGATSEGGPYGLEVNGYGTVFTQQIFSDGRGPETVLYDFQGPPDFWGPSSSPIVGTGALKKGFYGTCSVGGAYNQGGVYSLRPNGTQGLKETILYSFGAQPNDPILGGYGSLLQISPAGVLLGTSQGGGSLNGGALYELDPPTQAGEGWAEKLDLAFDGTDDARGRYPVGALLRMSGKYYGALQAGGIRGYKHGGFGAIYVASP